MGEPEGGMGHLREGTGAAMTIVKEPLRMDVLQGFKKPVRARFEDGQWVVYSQDGHWLFKSPHLWEIMGIIYKGVFLK